MAVVEIHMIDGTILISQDAEVVFDGKENSVFVHKPNGAYTNVNWNYVEFYHCGREIEDDGMRDLDG